MDQVFDFFTNLFGTESWPARWFCGEWTSFHGWLFILSDIAIWAAYFTIPMFIGMFILRRRDLPFHKVFWLFVAFILACGSTHLVDALAFWWPAYRFNALMRLITAVVSWTTVVALFQVVPQALSLRSPQELEREVQQRKHAEEQLQVKHQQLAAAQALAHIGSWEWDIANDTVTWSDELYRIMGLEPGEVELDYRTVLQCHPPEDAEKLRVQVARALETHEPFQLFLRIIRKGGEERVAHARGEVIVGDNGAPVRMVGTTQDVTTIKKAEEALEQKARELERSNAELEQFAYVASHDLQEPLRKIRTFGERLAVRHGDALGDDGKAQLDVMLNASVRMQALIEDLLHYSRLSITQENVEPTNLNEIVREVLSDLQISVEREGASVSINPLPVVEAVPGQMRQLFQNLISNALKFRKEGVKPEIAVTAGKASAEDVVSEGGTPLAPVYHRISVRDNGIGFEESYREKIFIAFQRLHGRDKYKGTGIGLAICKKIVENHQGFITVHSAPDAGSEFIVFLPVYRSAGTTHSHMS